MNITRRWPSILVGVVLAIGPAARPAPPQGADQSTAKQKTVQIRIAGMTCTACAKGLEASFRNLAGVVKAAVDYNAGQAVITFDTSKQSPESLSNFIRSCGYQVKQAKVV